MIVDIPNVAKEEIEYVFLCKIVSQTAKVLDGYQV